MSLLGLKNHSPDFAPLFASAAPAGERGGFTLSSAGPLLLGWRAERGAPQELAETTRAVYRDLLAATEGLALYRIWNQVPEINAVPAATQLENYRAFSSGRAEAFEEAYGPECGPRLPAASAVGTTAGELVVAFVAGPAEPRHFENPAQVPAYRYPAEHGPRAPSFARATRVEIGGRSLVFISGTAAIKGHGTVAPGELDAQVACTLDNLRLIGAATGPGLRNDARGWDRFFRIYLRHAEDRPVVEAALQRHLLVPGDRTEWRQADLCRRALRVEIEATLMTA